MKKFVSYSNCQAGGCIHFLKKTRLAEEYEFSHYNNYQIILMEQSSADLFRDACKADVFFYQPTPAIQYCELSTEDMIENIVPKDALKISFGYGFNHGFFPLVHHGEWQASPTIKDMAKKNPELLLDFYDRDALDFDCVGRFIECLREQTRRETIKECDIKMAPYISKSYRSEQLFLCENHPASAYLAELARLVVEKVTGEPAEKIPFEGTNDANLPCGLLVHPAVVLELGLDYPPEEGAQKFFREYLERLIAESAAK